MRLTAARRPKVLGFDLTPMIDVVLQLIIFFMFTSQFGQVTQTQVELPFAQGEQTPLEHRPSFVLDIASDGSLALEGKPISRSQFLRLVQSEIGRSGGADNVTILVRPDRSLAARPLNELALALRQLGVRRWSIGTAEPEGAG